MHDTTRAQARVAGERACTSSRLGGPRGRVRSLRGGAVRWRALATRVGVGVLGLLVLAAALAGSGFLYAIL